MASMSIEGDSVSDATLDSDIDEVESVGAVREAMDERLLEVNMRFEKALLASVERQLRALRGEVESKEMALEDEKEARTQLALALRRMRDDVNRLSAENVKLKASGEADRTKRAAALLEVTGLKREVEALTAARRAAETAAAAAEKRRDEAVAEVASLRAAGGALADDIKIRRNLEVGLSGEVSRLQRQLAVVTAERDAARASVEAARASAAEARHRTTEQENETRVAQRQLDKVVDELESMAASKTVLLRQWQEALEAMSKRDVAMQAIEEKRAAVHDALEEARRREGGLAARNDKLARNLAVTSTVLDRQRVELEKATSRAAEAEAKKDSLLAEVSAVRAGQAKLESQLVSLHGDRAALARKAEQLAASLAAKESEAERALAEARSVAREMEKRDLAAASAMVRVEEAAEADRAAAARRVLLTEAERQAAATEAAQLRATVSKLTVENGDLVRLYMSLTETYSKLAEEAEQLQRAFFRKEHDLNKLAAQLASTRAREGASEKPLKLQLRRARQLAAEGEAAYKKLQSDWLRTQSELLATQASLRRARELAERREAELGAVEGMADRLAAAEAAARKDGGDKDVEVDRLRVQLRRQDSQQAALRDAVMSLKKEKLDVESLLAVRQAEFEAATEALRGEAARLRAALAATQRARNAKLRDASHADGRVQLLREKLKRASAAAEASALRASKAEHALDACRREAADNERQFAATIKQLEVLFGKKRRVERAAARGGGAGDKKRSAAAAGRRLGKAGGSSSSAALLAPAARSRKPPGPRAARLASSASAAGLPAAAGGEAEDSHELVRRLNKMTTVSASRLNEIVQLQQQLSQAELSADGLKARNSKLKQRLHSLADEETSLRAEVKDLRARMARAEALAASLDMQIREIAPDALVRYDVVGGVGPMPSEELMAVLDATPVEAGDLSSYGGDDIIDEESGGDTASYSAAGSSDARYPTKKTSRPASFDADAIAAGDDDEDELLGELSLG
eukprot:PLAT5508.1.p1 GENE.PLAT5508.1~~PLAT5508.1.p1  ORF type:complete len:987 (-),score=584.40 PLAT5508.1:87-3047(-)